MNVFLSHSSQDRGFVETLAARLEMEGFKPWLCEMSIAAQSNWVQKMEEGLASADVVLLIWSAAAAHSYATELEWTSALAREIADRRVRLGIIRLQACDLPQLLRTRQYIDAGDTSRGIDAAVAWLKTRRDKGRFAGSKAPVYLPDYRPESFVGRGAYLQRLREALAPGCGMFLLTGEPGIGKSSLALTFAWEAQKDFDAVVYQICGRRAPEVIAAELLEQLGESLGGAVEQMPPEAKLKIAKQWLKQRESLLILDDVWLDGERGQNYAGEDQKATNLSLRDLLPGPPVTVLFTSRHPALFGLVPSQTEKVERFSPEEVEQVFRKYLPQEAVERHRAALLDLGDRVERLPVAVAVAADLLRRQFGPMDQAARKLALEKLKNEVHDVADLFDKAIQAQGPPERRLLEAASVCAPERFYLPLAFEIARLSPDEGENARDRLVNASLLRVLDSERQLFQLHALLRDRIRTTASSLENLRQAHAAALERLFARWETRWAECRECLQEIAPASQFLWSINEKSRGSWLSYSGYRTAERIGELALALHIIQCEESFWAARAGADCKDNLQRTYGDQALILQAWGRLKEALELHKKEEAICLELGNQDGLQRSYGNQAVILKAWGRLEEGLALHKKQETICLELGHQDGLQISYGNQALILYDWGRLKEALELHKKEEAICLELGNQDGLQRSYGNQALILHAWGRLEEALELHKKKEAICLELGKKQSLGYCYWNLGVLSREMGNPETAKEKLNTALAIFTELGMPGQRDAVSQALRES